ncbi:MAG: ABC transporter permease [Gammaproteobacteria bacterium]|nr:ABC transporter permease [Gammaproteobacteria bacterium]
MRIFDVLYYTWNALSRHRLRTILMLVAMMIGVAAIIVLTALGEGARRYVINEFASLGTNLIIVIPGKSETKGGSPSVFIGETPRDLTNDDAVTLLRIPGVRRIAPLVVGSVTVSWQGVERESPILGSSSSLLPLRHWKMASGQFLPDTDFDQAPPVCVIGSTIKRELFGTTNPVGQWLRIGDRRFRVIGILASEGRSIGMDVQDLVITPVAAAQSIFNTPSLFRILVEAKTRDVIPFVINDITDILKRRHQGEEDVTIITQDAILATFDKILSALTYAVAGIAAISLAVAGILIMNIMLVSISQRTAEIGLLKALGASQHKIIVLFLTEATMLASLGAVTGVLLGFIANAIIRHIYPAFPAGAPLWAAIGAAGIAMLTGLIFGAMPARRAAQLNPIEALAHK